MLTDETVAVIKAFDRRFKMSTEPVSPSIIKQDSGYAVDNIGPYIKILLACGVIYKVRGSKGFPLAYRPTGLWNDFYQQVLICDSL